MTPELPINRFVFRGVSAAAVVAAGGLFAPVLTEAAIIKTSDPTEVAAFMSGASVETFDDLPAFVISSYGPGQLIDDSVKFSSRNGNTAPTFHSGGASPNDPVGNPGSPIAIVSPTGGIAGDVASGKNVAAPTVIFENELFNNGFMEIIFPAEVARVGFWVTHGSITLDLRDSSGSTLQDGDFTTTANKGEFVGITRDNADVKVAAILANGVGVDAFTIDDLVYSVSSSGGSNGVPDGGPMLALALAGIGLVGASRRWLS